MKKTEKISKTIRFPQELIDRIELYCSEERISFSKAVIELLEKGNIIIITDGKDLVKYLFEVNRLLKNPELDEEIRESIKSTLEKLTDTIISIQDKYL